MVNVSFDQNAEAWKSQRSNPTARLHNEPTGSEFVISEYHHTGLVGLMLGVGPVIVEGPQQVIGNPVVVTVSTASYSNVLSQHQHHGVGYVLICQA